MQRAAQSRNAGAGAARRRELFVGVAAAALARSLARAERTHRAMLARGFRGELTSLDTTALDARAAIWAGILAAIVAGAAVWGRVA